MSIYFCWADSSLVNLIKRLSKMCIEPRRMFNFTHNFLKKFKRKLDSMKNSLKPSKITRANTQRIGKAGLKATRSNRDARITPWQTISIGFNPARWSGGPEPHHYELFKDHVRYPNHQAPKVMNLNWKALGNQQIP